MVLGYARMLPVSDFLLEYTERIKRFNYHVIAFLLIHKWWGYKGDPLIYHFMLLTYLHVQIGCYQNKNIKIAFDLVDLTMFRSYLSRLSMFFSLIIIGL